jgi:hypothetical protein
VEHYSLQAIIAVGFKIENERAVQFRKWANQIVKDYTIQGWTMDAERLKHGGTLTDEFFRNPPGCGQSERGTGEGPRRKLVRKIPHRAGPLVRVGLCPDDRGTTGERGKTMITEDPLEQLAIQWFQDTGWNYVHGAVNAPEAEPFGDAFQQLDVSPVAGFIDGLGEAFVGLALFRVVLVEIRVKPGIDPRSRMDQL